MVAPDPPTDTGALNIDRNLSGPNVMRAAGALRRCQEVAWWSRKKCQISSLPGFRSTSSTTMAGKLEIQ
jgi:hypothetical protein